MKKFTAKSFIELEDTRPSPPVVDDETNDKTEQEVTPIKEMSLPHKRKAKKCLKEDSDFEVSECRRPDEEAVDDSSDQDDFVERTQNSKKQAKKKTVKVSNKYKGLDLQPISKDKFHV